LIHRFLKKLTSSGVFALKTTKVRKAAHKTKAINKIAHKNPKACLAVNGFLAFCFFCSMFSGSLTFI